MLILNYRTAPEGIPLLDICGLPLAIRGALEGIRTGYSRIYLLVHGADQSLVDKTLQQDSRLTTVRAVSTVDELLQGLRLDPRTGSREIGVVQANRVQPVGALADLKSRSSLEPFLAGQPLSAQFTRYQVEPVSSAAFLQQVVAALPQPESTGAAETVAPGGSGSFGQWPVIHSQRDVGKAEQYLMKGLVKEADGVISRNINRKISLAVTRRLMKSAITPNQVTTVVLLIGILSGPAILLIGGYSGLVLGGLLYYLSAILDGCDGELSRLKYMATPYGAWMDTVVDDTVGLSYILGLYSCLAGQSEPWGWIGGGAVSCYLLTLGPRYYVMANFLGSGDYQKLAAAKPKKTPAHWPAQLLRTLEDTVCRTDFIPFAAFTATLLHGAEIFAALFFLGTIGAAIDSLHSFSVMKRHWQTPTT